MKLLIGNTGLIGTTLKDSISFDREFNSSNIQSLRELEIPVTTDIYLSCLPATKWKVNQDPNSDLDNILNIIDILSTKTFRNVILYSTIDVYENCLEHSNEDVIPKLQKLSYGVNRYLFELLVRNNIKYDKLLILRLPALFGKHIKKNILYDLLNDNQIEKIQIKSKFQWYNLNNLVTNTNHFINTHEKFLCVNLFSEPIDTSEIVKLFNNKKVDTKKVGISYDYHTKHSHFNYFTTATDTLNEIRTFISEYGFFKRNIKIAICLFGEQRDLINHIPYWKNIQSKFQSVDFHIATYVDANTESMMLALNSELKLKNYYIGFNDLDKFNSLKYTATQPIYIYKTDIKATMPRLLSQLHIRQKAVELVNFDEYDVILLCRTDIENLNLSIADIVNVVNDKNLLIVSNELHHIHPGGGSGCINCTLDSRCDDEYHSNDICDLWCIGSTDSMKPWLSIFDKSLEYYKLIQNKSIELSNLESKEVYVENVLYDNEIHITFPIQQLQLIENDVHCFYPEKLMRVAFNDMKICGSIGNKNI